MRNNQSLIQTIKLTLIIGVHDLLEEAFLFVQVHFATNTKTATGTSPWRMIDVVYSERNMFSRTSGVSPH